MSTAEDERYIPGTEIASRVVDSVRSLGEQTAFIGNALISTVDAVRRYPGEVLRLIARGRSNKEIADDLGLSINTVSAHRSNMMRTLGIHKAAELVTYAITNGLIDPI